MQHKLLMLAASAALFSSTAALAQGDECTGALALVNGANGPFTNAGSTTSVPAWPCAAGGNDVWFSYVATASGTCVINTCGGTFDSALEVFDGAGGCGGASLQCNDDFCGLQSSVTFQATNGTTYYIRMGGFGGATGSAPINVTPPTPPQPNTLTTNYNGGAALAAPAVFFFDLTVNVPLTFNTIEVNSNSPASTPGSIDVYTTPTTYVGNDTNPLAWTLVGNGAVTAAGPGQPSPASVAFALTPGTYGIALQYNGIAPLYSVGATTYSTPELTLVSGASSNGALGTAICCTPRDWNGTIRYAPTGSGTVAIRQNYGAGCYDRSTVYYENFAAGTFDLSGTATLSNNYLNVPNGVGGYALIPGGGQWFTPVSANLGLTDDSVSAPQTLPFTMNYPGGSTNTIRIGSNGMVFPTSTTSTDFSPSVAELLGQMQRWCPLWRDLNPATGGTVHFDVDPSNTIAYVTFLAVPNFGAPAALNTFQVAFTSAGVVEYRYQVCDLAGATITGYTTGALLGAPAADPGTIDLSLAITQAYTTGPGGRSLALNASARPLAGTTLQMALSNIPGPDLGAVVVNFAAVIPGIDLGFQGMPGCLQHIALNGAVTVGITIGNGSVPFSIPVSTQYLGTNVFLQGGAFVPGTNPLGVITSNGVRLVVGNL